MRKVFILLTVILKMTGCQNLQLSNQKVITADITNFWEAYDQIIATNDSVLQLKYLDSLYIKKGTVGLAGIMQARNYTPQKYINAINNYPLFWKSIRKNTFEVDKIGSALESGIDKLKEVYPKLKPAKIYFTVGALRTGGTTIDSLVLIGAEISMADHTTITSEFQESLSHLKPFFKTNPKNHLVFLNVHEYVHTQ